MKLLWTLLKLAIAACVIIPLAIFVLAAALGILGALMGLAILALKIGVIGLIIVGGYKLLSSLFGDKKPDAPVIRELPRVDPHYEAAMRELNRELGETR
jgi:hypothetical protein